MGELLKKMMRFNYDTSSAKQIEDVAEGAALMQEQHASDILSLGEIAGVKPSDVRIQRAAAVAERLR